MYTIVGWRATRRTILDPVSISIFSGRLGEEGGDYNHSIGFAPSHRLPYTRAPRSSPNHATPSSSNFNSTKAVSQRILSGWKTDKYMSMGMSMCVGREHMFGEAKQRKRLGISHLKPLISLSASSRISRLKRGSTKIGRERESHSQILAYDHVFSIHGNRSFDLNRLMNCIGNYRRFHPCCL